MQGDFPDRDQKKVEVQTVRRYKKYKRFRSEKREVVTVKSIRRNNEKQGGSQMAHELEIINGKAQMFSVLETPWHGLGAVLNMAPSAAEAQSLAGLDFKVSLQDLFLGNSTKVEQKAIVRDTDGAVLGFVQGDKYVPFQNSEMFDFMAPFIAAGCTFETGGSLRGGQRVWVLVKLNKNDVEITDGDVVRKFLMVSSGHDGKTCIRVGFTPTRVVCMNTLRMAHDNEASKLLRVIHSNKTQMTMETIQKIINTANESFEATAEQYRKLAKSAVKIEDISKYVDQVFYNGSQAESDREKMARESLNSKIVSLFQYGRGQNNPAVKGTAWALYNAVTEYLSYEKGKTQDTRLNSLWFGEGANINDKALEAALVMAR